MEKASLKKIDRIFPGNETIDGAGVRLRRMFGGHATATFTDPFLLLDHFGSDDPKEYISGFPWHPHRGIETVTYLMEGKVDHEDSEGHKGTIYPGDIQWMTAGSGIFHQEMPRPLDHKNPEEAMKITGMPNSVVGLQLWINLPANLKMATPTYRSITGKSTPMVDDDSGNSIRIVAGHYGNHEGAFSGNARIDPIYLEVRMPEESEFRFEVRDHYTSIINTLTGRVYAGKDEILVDPRSAVVFSQSGNEILVETDEEKASFILLSGRPLREPIYWYGPIVMNSQEQINEALLDLRRNTFVREKEPIFQ